MPRSTAGRSTAGRATAGARARRSGGGKDTSAGAGRRYHAAVRLAALALHVARAGAAGVTREELLADALLGAIYSGAGGGGQQALWRDLRRLCEVPLRAVVRGDTAGGPDEALARRDAATGRYRLVQPLGVARLSEAALDGLCALALALRQRMALFGADPLAELAGALPEDQRERLQAALLGEAPGRAVPVLDLGLATPAAVDAGVSRRLSLARQRRQLVSFEYRPAYDARGVVRHQGDQVIEVRYADHPYVTIYCDEAHRDLELRIDRIVAGTLSVEPQVAAPRRRRRLAVSYWLAPALVRGGISERLEDQRHELQEDGSAIVSGMARDVFWARRLLLGYGAGARALTPPALVAEMRRESEGMRRQYTEVDT